MHRSAARSLGQRDRKKGPRSEKERKAAGRQKNPLDEATERARGRDRTRLKGRGEREAGGLKVRGSSVSPRSRGIFTTTDSVG